MGRISGVTTKKTSASAAVTVASLIDYMPLSTLVKSFNSGNGLNDWNTYTLDYETDVLGVYNAGANVCNVATSRTDNLNITNLWDNVTAANNQTLSYSPANRLSNASGAYGTRVWGYDGVGNRTQEISTVAAVIGITARSPGARASRRAPPW